LRDERSERLLAAVISWRSVMKKLLLTTSLLAGITCLAAPASAENPIFKNSAHTKLDSNQMKSVKGQGSISDYYGYYGILNANYSSYLGSVGYNYNDYGTENYYYYYAYIYSTYAATDFYNAYLNAGF
jgi:hypothetical protein